AHLEAHADLDLLLSLARAGVSGGPGREGPETGQQAPETGQEGSETGREKVGKGSVKGRETPVRHGGDLGAAMALAGDTEENRPLWLDLSTGVSPFAYPAAAVEAEGWTALPQRDALAALLDAAARQYGAPDAQHMAA